MLLQIILVLLIGYTGGVTSTRTTTDVHRYRFFIVNKLHFFVFIVREPRVENVTVWQVLPIMSKTNIKKKVWLNDGNYDFPLSFSCAQNIEIIEIRYTAITYHRFSARCGKKIAKTSKYQLD
ncbi:uncharacterized protein EV154DRAFT_548671 [Mucor mucedo]|uniref:uncharacterized protein n=1 Tax=Mucor mucedo TaxID=29922 RepID=UPI002220F417|nr:uncharacterized protein EV154DRAFT_548671 [Mucor mucedo]KAI7894784.1 hypothetical protein EV154DRAFT_548671 [Mucor mucedo]